MQPFLLFEFSQLFFSHMEELLPEFLADPTDKAIADGNVVCLIMDSSGNLIGKQWGDDPVKQRLSSHVAWSKVQQVHLTNEPTYVYEQKVYRNELKWWEYGIPLPELIGWEGGLPIQLPNGINLSIAFSGFRGDKDCEIIRKAIQRISVHL